MSAAFKFTDEVEAAYRAFGGDRDADDNVNFNLLKLRVAAIEMLANRIVEEGLARGSVATKIAIDTVEEWSDRFPLHLFEEMLRSVDDAEVVIRVNTIHGPAGCGEGLETARKT